MQFIRLSRWRACLVGLVGLVATSIASAQETVTLTVTTEGLREATSSTQLYLNDPSFRAVMVPSGDELTPDPTAEDLPADERVEKAGTGFAGPGVESYFEVAQHQKCWILGPYYQASERLRFKARLPLIFARTLTYYDAEPSASGLGDLNLQINYGWPARRDAMRLQARLDVIIPTGDSDHLEGDHLVPLGTGAWGFSFGGQVQRKFARAGWLASAAVRKNTPHAVTVQHIQADTVLATTANDITNAASLAVSAFGWRSLTNRLAAHLGASLLVVGDGKTAWSQRDAAGVVTGGEYGNGQGMVILDLYPGLTYRLGRLDPFLGVRVPIVSSYDAERDREDRDLAVILQFSYNPGRMSHAVER